MARGRGSVQSTSSRGVSSNTTNQINGSSPVNSRASDAPISRSTSGRGGYLNTSNRQPLPHVPHGAHASPVAPRAPVAPFAPRAPVAPQAPHVPVAPRAPVAPFAPRVLVAPQAPHVPVAPQAPRVPVAPQASRVPVAPIVPHAAHVPPLEEVNEDANPPNDQVNPPNNQPRNTRGLTTGVKAPNNGQPKILVTVLKSTLIPAKAISKINEIFRRHYNELRTKWSHWNDELNDMWADYLRYFRFATPGEEKRGRIVWEHIAAQNFPKYLFGWKRSALKAYGTIEAAKNHTPEWTSSDVWKALCKYWLCAEFTRASELRKKNLASAIKNIPHTSGRVPYEEVDLKLHASLGRAPTQIERFTSTHIKKNKSSENNEKIWITKDAEELQVVYANELREANGLDPAVPVNAILNPGCDAVSDPGCKAWQVVAGGVRKGRLFGRPGEKWKKRSGCASSVDYAAYISSQNSTEEIRNLKEALHANTKKLDQESKEKNELKAYVKSMAPLWAEMAERCGMGPCPSPPLFSNASSSTPSSDGGSNVPMVTSPFDDYGENDDDMP